MTAHLLKKGLILTGTVSVFAMILTLPSVVGAQPAADPPYGNVDASFNSVTVTDGTDDNFVVHSDGSVANDGTNNGGRVMIDDGEGLDVQVTSGSPVGQAFRVTGKTGDYAGYTAIANNGYLQTWIPSLGGFITGAHRFWGADNGAWMDVFNDGNIRIFRPNTASTQGLIVANNDTGGYTSLHGDGHISLNNPSNLKRIAVSATGHTNGGSVNLNNDGTIYASGRVQADAIGLSFSRWSSTTWAPAWSTAIATSSCQPGEVVVSCQFYKDPDVHMNVYMNNISGNGCTTRVNNQTGSSRWFYSIARCWDSSRTP